MVNKTKILTNNELIAEFMGWFKTPDQPETWFNKSDNLVAYQLDKDPLKELPFHKDWNYLMEVVLKIQTLGYGMEITPATISIYDMNKAQYQSRYESLILPIFYNTNEDMRITIWLAVVRFIKWWLSENKK